MMNKQEASGRSMTSGISVYQMKMTLRDVTPEIWRRVLVRPDVRLSRLHKIIQTLMGWGNYHLYQFVIDGKVHTPPDDDLQGPRESVEIPISLIACSAEIIYEYDFGDGWEVTIQIEDKLHNQVSKRMAVCIGGERNGPLEDSGGPLGYMEKLSVLRKHQGSRYLEVREWMPEDFDPEAFALDEIDRKLSRLRASRFLDSENR